MEISTKGRYGIKAILDLSINARENHVALNQVAERQNISERYLEQVFSILRKAGFIKSVKGPQGGYSLDCDPKTTTIGDLLRALEGDLSLQRVPESGDITGKCINNVVWKAIDDSVRETTEKITLDDLIDSYKKEINDSAYMFYI